jgi:hypothetical protein
MPTRRAKIALAFPGLEILEKRVNLVDGPTKVSGEGLPNDLGVPANLRADCGRHAAPLRMLAVSRAKIGADKSLYPAATGRGRHAPKDSSIPVSTASRIRSSLEVKWL